MLREAVTRGSRRISFPRPVHVLSLAGRATPKRLFSSNLSLGGMFVRTPAPLSKGERVRLSLEAKGRVLPFAEGEVTFTLPPSEAWGKGRLPGFGVRFTRLPGRSRALIEYLVNARG
jgi:Tfp pilus assembly protein PilZ